jgi:hypothetical protein
VITKKTNRSHMIGDHHDQAASTATLLRTATHGVLGTDGRIATAQPAGLTVLCGERDARYHGKELIADELSRCA